MPPHVLEVGILIGRETPYLPAKMLRYIKGTVSSKIEVPIGYSFVKTELLGNVLLAKFRHFGLARLRLRSMLRKGTIQFRKLVADAAKTTVNSR